MLRYSRHCNGFISRHRFGFISSFAGATSACAPRRISLGHWYNGSNWRKQLPSPTNSHYPREIVMATILVNRRSNTSPFCRCLSLLVLLHEITRGYNTIQWVICCFSWGPVLVFSHYLFVWLVKSGNTLRYENDAQIALSVLWATLSSQLDSKCTLIHCANARHAPSLRLHVLLEFWAN